MESCLQQFFNICFITVVSMFSPNQLFPKHRVFNTNTLCTNTILHKMFNTLQSLSYYCSCSDYIQPIPNFKRILGKQPFVVQHSCLENPVDGGAWKAAVPGVATSWTRLHFHFHFSLSCTGEGNGNPLQCSCLENPRDGRNWWAAIYGVAQSRTRLK